MCVRFAVRKVHQGEHGFDVFFDFQISENECYHKKIAALLINFASKAIEKDAPEKGLTDHRFLGEYLR